MPDRVADRSRAWFTCVIPHVLVPQLADALRMTTARRALVLNLAAEPGETAGFSAERHIHVLAQHAPDFTVHDIIVDASQVPSEREREQLSRTATILEAGIEFADVSRPGTSLHDPAKLAAALKGVGVRATAPGRTAQEPTVPTPAAGSADVPRQEPAPNSTRGDVPWR